MKLRLNLKLSHKYLKVILISILLSFFIALIIYNKSDTTILKEQLLNYPETLTNTSINYLIFHFIILSIILTSSIFLIGFFIFPFYLIYELICIFYNMISFTNIFGLKGLLFSLLFNLLIKVFYFILITILIIKLYKILKNILKVLLKIEDKTNTNSLLKHFKAILFLIFTIIINDLFIYFFANKILLHLTFLLK